MILNLIAQNVPINDLSTQILSSHEIPTDTAFESTEMVPLENQLDSLSFSEVSEEKSQLSQTIFKFKMQDIEYIERGVHCTKGILL